MTNGSTSGLSASLEGIAPPPAGGHAYPHRRAVLAAVVVCVLAGVVASLGWALVADRVRTITEGRVYQSGALEEGDLRETVQRLGIRTVIDLRQPWEGVGTEGTQLSALGIEHIHIPSGQLPEDATVNRFLEVMSDPATYPVLIHCHHGIGRSVLFSAIYRIEFEGWDGEQARKASRLLLHLRRFVPGGSFAIGGPKGAYLLRYAARRQAVAGAQDAHAAPSFQPSIMGSQ
jgi:protein tyrosine phosphatase (PTP) superfamily phosphohydrolase (DUF442 family)